MDPCEPWTRQCERRHPLRVLQTDRCFRRFAAAHTLLGRLEAVIDGIAKEMIEIFHNERPHEALEMKYPAEVYPPSTCLYKGLPDVDYPFHDKITNRGRICLGHKKINFSAVFAGQAVGIKEVQDDIWLVSFMDCDLGYLDLETRVLEPLDNPFGARLLPM